MIQTLDIRKFKRYNIYRNAMDIYYGKVAQKILNMNSIIRENQSYILSDDNIFNERDRLSQSERSKCENSHRSKSTLQIHPRKICVKNIPSVLDMSVSY